ncbi:MAG TPA: DNA polymerase III subunit gamma/tau C-terminal domain-containing protein [Accumulibacter sp.]|nr:DNA polymerase III subunit gamma/tau C-terminal domain-containing protein [Accumulibacter sp.]
MSIGVIILGVFGGLIAFGKTMARELAQNCLLRELGTPRIVLSLDPAQRHLLIKPAQDKLQQAFCEHFGRSMLLSIQIEDIVGDTPAALAQRDRQERMERAIAAVEEDGFVREVIDLFDATLIQSSIKPV